MKQSSNNEHLHKQGHSSKKWSKQNIKLPPNYFLFVAKKLKHFIGDCAKFKKLSVVKKRKMIIEAGKCLNCLSVERFVHDCELHSKCYKYGLKYKNKHSGALHKFYSRPNLVNFGATKPVSTVKFNGKEKNTENIVARKMIPNNNNLRVVLLCTNAEKVINPSYKRCTLMYAQHDTASQVNLISEILSNELGLEMKDSHTIAICMLAEETMPSTEVVQFNLESLTNKEIFVVKDIVVVPGFMDDEYVFSHKIDTANLKNFKGVKIPIVPKVNSVDILIRQPYKFFLTVLEKREEACPKKPNYVITRLGPIVSGGL